MENKMKVKDVISQLQQQDPEMRIVMKNLFANPVEPSYVLEKIRVYHYKGQVFIDGYTKVPS